MGHPVHRERVYARIAQQHFEPGPRSRILLQDDRDIFAQALEHPCSPILVVTFQFKRFAAAPGDDAGKCGQPRMQTAGMRRGFIGKPW
ncbi:MAG: hypothetical protein M5U30_20860 [Burkholderiaceae bacterium]|nr:hypothetical protein [Burkholderiaceae bacterium]